MIRTIVRRKWTLALAVVLIVAGSVAYALRPSDDRRRGSVVVEGAELAFADTPPKSYGVTYRAETYSGDDVTYATEELVVRRPFEARMETRRGRPPGGSSIGVTVNAFARMATGDGVFAVAPSPAALDARPDAYLADAVRAGFAERREVRRVARRLCRVFRTQGSGPLEKLSRSPDDYTDRCFDERGVLLEELTVSDGEPVSRRVAVRTSQRPTVDDESFETRDPTLPVDKGGGSVQRLRAGSKPPGDFFEVRRDPKGFEHEGRFAVIPPQAGFADPRERGRIVAFTSDVWVDGIDTIAVEQGSTLGGTVPFERVPQAPDVELGELGRGQIVYHPAAVEVRVFLGGGRFARLFGTVPPTELVAVARSLERVEGGAIVVDDS